jgi:hypothetical protein
VSRSSSSTRRRKRDALLATPAALPAAALLFADAALATQSASSVASFPPVASFETAVYAVSCYLDTMVQQSLAGNNKRRRRGADFSVLERLIKGSNDAHLLERKNSKLKTQKKKNFL